MRLDANALRYLSNGDFKVLRCVEQGMRNHEFVPLVLISSLAKMPRPVTKQNLSTLHRCKLVVHDGHFADAYKLTYLGYDYLALKAFANKGFLTGVGRRVGVGKESDIHVCNAPDGRILCLKFHRLGRVSFRSIKRNRDYLQHRTSASWLFLAKLAARKEYAYMEALHGRGFPVPEPIDINRHVVLMEYVDAYPLSQVKELGHPGIVLEKLMKCVVRFGRCGLIHCDFNEFNLLIDDDENITIIDFPQIISISHPNASYYFERDVKCIRNYFKKKFRIDVTEYPQFSDITSSSSANDPIQEVNVDSFSGSNESSTMEKVEVEVDKEWRLLEGNLSALNVVDNITGGLGEEDSVVDNSDSDNNDGGDGDDDEDNGSGDICGGGEFKRCDGLEEIGGDENRSIVGGGEGTDELADDEAEEARDANFAKGVAQNIWRPKIRRPKTSKVANKIRQKKRRDCGGVNIQKTVRRKNEACRLKDYID